MEVAGLGVCTGEMPSTPPASVGSGVSRNLCKKAAPGGSRKVGRLRSIFSRVHISMPDDKACLLQFGKVNIGCGDGAPDVRNLLS